MTCYEAAWSEIKAVFADSGERDDILQQVCEILERNIPHYDWVGYYYAIPAEHMLELGPFVGAPTDHTRIPYGKGICGQVAESEATFMVPDVQAQDNYLSCSIHVRSEIVVPVMKLDEFVAQLDIDSHMVNPFTDEDTELLDRVCELSAHLF